jgi:hypothetical protein
MERERQMQRSVPASGGGPEALETEPICTATQGILNAADQILDSIRPVNAEDYLQRNRQRGGQ